MFSSCDRSTEERIQSTSAPAEKLLPVAGEHHCARTSDVDERFGKLPDQGRVEGVVTVGACQRDPQELAVTLDPEVVHRERA